VSTTDVPGQSGVLPIYREKVVSGNYGGGVGDGTEFLKQYRRFFLGTIGGMCSIRKIRENRARVTFLRTVKKSFYDGFLTRPQIRKLDGDQRAPFAEVRPVRVLASTRIDRSYGNNREPIINHRTPPRDTYMAKELRRMIRPGTRTN